MTMFAEDVTCTKGYQPLDKVCISQRMVDYIACVRNSGGNLTEIKREVSNANSNELSVGAKGSGSGVVAKGSGAATLNKNGEQDVAEKIEAHWGSEAMKECRLVLNGSTGKPKASTSQAAPLPQPNVQIDAGASVDQKATAPCSGNAIGGSVDNSGCTAGYVPPPARLITPDNATAAKTILNSAPPGSRVYFIVVGSTSDPEIRNFDAQVEELFDRNVWRVTYLKTETFGLSMPGQTTQLTGLMCQSLGGDADKYQIVRDGLAKAGFTCSDGYPPLSIAFIGQADVAVLIRSRT